MADRALRTGRFPKGEAAGDRKVAACQEAAIQAFAALEVHGLPVPPEGADRVEMLERLRDGIAALVDRLPEGE